MTKEKLESLLDDKEIFNRLTTRIVNKRHFFRDDEELDTPLTGAAALIGERISEMARKVVRHDYEIAPFKIYGSEIKERLRIELPSGRTVNFKFAIDRLDEVTVDGKERLRIVDYKTGGIKLDAKDFSSMMEGESESKQIFQLFTYAWLLGKAGIPSGEDVITEIYDVPGILKDSPRLPKISKKVVKGFSEYSGQFSDGIEKMLEDVFTAPSFKATTDDKHCEYCAFRSLCRR
ncbi:MAG: PD-(D/E)XK nuclease family protein [Muribaculaceae bacterium]|nr:PD-(D/E)XK nuclease family protein [Muribaculaceae bacterium]